MKNTCFWLENFVSLHKVILVLYLLIFLDYENNSIRQMWRKCILRTY